MRRRNNRRGKSKGKIVGILLFLLVAAAAAYVYTAPNFERVKPQIEGPDNMVWNRKDPLKIKITDNQALKDFEIVLSDGKNSIIVGKDTFSDKPKEKILSIKYPKSKTIDKNAKELKLEVTAHDSSFWNLLQGNSVKKIFNISVDSKRPNVNILSNSYSITQGGSALVVFQAYDENMDSLYVQVGKKKFKAQPYKKEGYYAALIAWPFQQKGFSAKVIAIDQAKNKRVANVPLYIKSRKYKVSWIRAKDKFIDGKITDLASSDPEYSDIEERLEKLKIINETMREKNEEVIHALGEKVSDEMFNEWKIKKFYPLKNSAIVAKFGDERHYYYKNKSNEVSASYHVGYDMASTKMADIKTSNPGTVVYANENGIYGNMPMIDHGLGLYTLYGHCSQLFVKEGDEIGTGEVIAKTGMTGLALGDHLHFGVLVQGVEVRPIEWLDQKWIEKNIDNVFKVANKIIDGK